MLALLLVEMDDDFGVALGDEAVPGCHQPVAELLEVVDLAVLHHPHRAIFVGNRLMAAGDVDDAQSAVAQHRARLGRCRNRGNANTPSSSGPRWQIAVHIDLTSDSAISVAVEIDDAGDAAHVMKPACGLTDPGRRRVFDSPLRPG